MGFSGQLTSACSGHLPEGARMQIVNCTYESSSDRILEILNDAIVNSTALYDYQPRGPDSMISWFKAKEAGNYPVIGTFDKHGHLIGFASFGVFRNWPAYKYSIEHSVYIRQECRGKGIGTYPIN